MTKQQLQIDCNFPGGNIVVEDIAGATVHLHQDLRDTRQDWFYWCFRVRGAAGRTVQFVFTKSRALGVRGPAVSRDQGSTWQWLGAAAVQDNAFSYAFTEQDEDLRFSFGMPYQASHWRCFADSLQATPHFALQPLCATTKGRAVEYAVLGCLQHVPAYRVALACRHHCCEMMASYALEGLIAWVVQDADAGAAWLRDNVQFLCVPFADLDGVEDGDQGKGRHPRDHGRDYAGVSIHAATAALRALLPAWSAGRLRVAIDLHCPWLAGEHNEALYLVGAEDPRAARAQRHFSAILEAVQTGPLHFSAADYLPFGCAWNTNTNTTGGQGFARWARTLPGIDLGTALEIPYANARGAEVNQISARQFGRDLAAAIAVYLKETKEDQHSP
ncbi:MAG: peptidase M14 [bacterium]|nr:peptidase M14 [bacterium]